jgi:DASS family divalent anion:Na+ symporter
MLIFATNFFSPITPQGSSANIIFVGSGYLDTGELYKYGGLVVLINSVIYLTIGSAWLLMLY